MNKAVSNFESVHTLTVLLPVRNSERWIGEALESLRQQTFQDFQVLIIDDNSNDKTLDIVKSSGLSEVQIIQGPGEGIAAALALGVKTAKSPYLARQDADDLSDPYRFQRQMDYLRHHPECVVLGSWARLIDGDGQGLGRIKMPVDNDAIKLAMNFYSPFIHPSVILRRDAVINSGNYRQGPTKVFSEDYDLWSRMWPYGQLHNLSEVLVSYRINNESITGSNGNMVKRSGSTISIRTTEESLGQELSENNRRIYSLFYGRHRKISLLESLRLYGIMLKLVRKSSFSEILSATGIKRWTLPLVWVFRQPKNKLPLWGEEEDISHCLLK